MTFSPSEPQRLLAEHMLANPVTAGFVGMGIGKTATTLYALNELLHDLAVRAALVVAPLRVVNLTWPNEVEKWEQFRWMRVANLRTQEGKQAFIAGTAQLYLINYESLHVVGELLKKRKGKLPYDVEVFDECFAKGSKVLTDKGEKPIEQIKKGDRVANATGFGAVVETFKNLVHEAAIVKISGKRILCSSTHLFLSERGWIEARCLKSGEAVRRAGHCSMPEVREADAFHKNRSSSPAGEVLLQKLLCEIHEGASKNKAGEGVRGVWSTIPLPAEKDQRGEVLLKGVQCTMESSCFWATHSDSRTASADFGAHEKELGKPRRGFSQTSGKNNRVFQEQNAGNVQKDISETQGDRAQASSTWGQWMSDTLATTSSCGPSETARVGCPLGKSDIDEGAPLPGETLNTLQNRHRASASKGGDRSGWVLSQQRLGQRKGCEEGEISGLGWVEDVEILQQSDPRLDQFREADGSLYFYDLSVSGHPSYCVEGYVVHNCTKAKSHSSKRINAFRKLLRAPRRWGLTGTPAPNSLMDLFAQIRLLDDGAALGTSFTRFQQHYFDSDYMGWTWTPKGFAKDAINKAIAHLTVTLSSEDWLDIPDVHIEDVEVSLPDPASYRQFERDLLIEIEGQTVTAANAAVLLGKLQQFTSGALYMEDKSTVHLHDAKLDALAAIVKKTDGPVLVAVNFQSEQDRLRVRFPKAKFFADAKTATEQQALLAAWNAGKVPMLVAHPASVGHGLNLQHGGNTLVWMTLTFSRENYEQMIARLARRGQENVTTVYRLVCPGTVDDVVVEALREKKETERSLLDSLKLLEKAAAQRS